MNHAQFQYLNRAAKPAVGRDFPDLGPRTLLLGFNENRDVGHVYMTASRKIEWVLYAGLLGPVCSPTVDGLLEYKGEADVRSNAEYVEQFVQVYPEACDFDFCWSLRESGILTLPFLGFSEERRQERRAAHRPYHAKAHAELAGNDCVPLETLAGMLDLTQPQYEASLPTILQALTLPGDAAIHYRHLGRGQGHLLKSSIPEALNRCRESLLQRIAV
jgi:hypothetical protein